MSVLVCVCVLSFQVQRVSELEEEVREKEEEVREKEEEARRMRDHLAAPAVAADNTGSLDNSILTAEVKGQ